MISATMVVKPITARGTRKNDDFFFLSQRMTRNKTKMIRGKSKSQKEGSDEKKVNIFFSIPLNCVLHRTEL